MFAKNGAAILVMALSLATVGCAQMGGSSSKPAASAPEPVATSGKPAPAPVATSGKPAPAPVATSGKPGPGMNADGVVTDASKVEAGHGQKVKGLGDWEGEITGKPLPNSKFAQLKMGMGMRQVVDIAGQPTDQGAYLTGKAFIPFYFGSDRTRFEMIYKGQGRLIFAGGSLGDYTGGNLTWIIYCPTEPGYR
jgi:hypothetical protein